MDADRKSTVSSFYGGRKPSVDALNNEYVTTPLRTGHRDDGSSFFTPERSSMDHLASGRPSAGYNRGTFHPSAREEPLKGGRDEEKDLAMGGDAWDVYADFNNAGPRYSSALLNHTTNAAGYSQLPPPSPMIKEEFADPEGKVEMVTVPALGPEWAKDEMRDMTKSGRRERKKEARKQFWKEWNRGQRGLCGKYFTRKVLVFFLFGLCVAVGIVLAITIPRVPRFAFNGGTPLVPVPNSDIPTIFSRSVPANFSFAGAASLQVDTTSNVLPIVFTHLRATVFDLDTNKLVGSGDYQKHTLPAKSFPRIQLPLNFTYVADNSSDVTWTNWYNACRNRALSTDNQRPPLKFRLVIDMDIQGLPSTRSTSAQIADADCPVELPLNAA